MFAANNNLTGEMSYKSLGEFNLNNGKNCVIFYQR